MKHSKQEIPFNGYFEDSDLEYVSATEEDEQSDEDARKRRKQPKQKKIYYPPNKIIMNVSDTQYPVVKFVGKMLMKWKLQYETEVWSWDLMWTDNAVQPETLARMQPYQKINHFPGMYQLARKNYLGRNLGKMFKSFPDDYKFFPRTWLLPTDFNDFKAQFQKGKMRTFIVKPEASCQGRGIFLTRNIEDINPQDHYVAQRYLHKPYLVDGLKFDLRLYVLLAGCDPLRVFLYKEGLARFATEPYNPPHTSNLDNVCMHLTNYAINKDNPNFIFNQQVDRMDVGHKRSFTSLVKLLQEQGKDTETMMRKIEDIIIKTFCSVLPVLQQNYRCTQSENYMNNMCFEVLGFDIYLDHSLKPYLLEVNHTPSFSTDTPLDSHIKKNLIRDTVILMNINIQNKNEIINERKEQMQRRVLTGKKVKLTQEERQTLKAKAQVIRDEWETKHLGDYVKIYPLDVHLLINRETEQETHYERFIQVAQKQYEEWTGASIRRNPKRTIDCSVDQPVEKKKEPVPRMSTKNPLYKNVQSKVNSNLRPKDPVQEDQYFGEDSPNIESKYAADAKKHHEYMSQQMVGEDNQTGGYLPSCIEYPTSSNIFDHYTHRQIWHMSNPFNHLQYPPANPFKRSIINREQAQAGLVVQASAPLVSKPSIEQSPPQSIRAIQQQQDVQKTLSPTFMQYQDLLSEPKINSDSRKKMFSIKRQMVNQSIAKTNSQQNVDTIKTAVASKVTFISSTANTEKTEFISNQVQAATRYSVNKSEHLLHDTKITSSGQFLRPKVFNLNFIPQQEKKDTQKHKLVPATNNLAQMQLLKWMAPFQITTKNPNANI